MYLYFMFNTNSIVLKKEILALILLLVLAGCKEETTPLSYNSELLNKENLALCEEGLCPDISIDKLIASGGSFADTINGAIDKHLINLLVMDPDEVLKIKTFDEALENFVNNYRMYRNDFPDAIPGYEVSSESKIAFSKEQLLCLEFKDYTYYGGAHGYGSTHFINLDKETQQMFTPETLFKDLSAFKSFAEKRFRSQYNIDPDQDLGETGFFFENDTFILPQNIGFKNDQLILLYNPYEIASYAEGQLELKFNLTEVQEFLIPSL